MLFTFHKYHFHIQLTEARNEIWQPANEQELKTDLSNWFSNDIRDICLVHFVLAAVWYLWWDAAGWPTDQRQLWSSDQNNSFQMFEWSNRDSRDILCKWFYHQWDVHAPFPSIWMTNIQSSMAQLVDDSEQTGNPQLKGIKKTERQKEWKQLKWKRNHAIHSTDIQLAEICG